MRTVAEVKEAAGARRSTQAPAARAAQRGIAHRGAAMPLQRSSLRKNSSDVRFSGPARM
jgi:hypothetical protein